MVRCHFPRASTSAASVFAESQVLIAKRKNFSHIFQECTREKALSPGKQAHARMIISGFEPTVFVTNCLIQMYIKCSGLDIAYKVFDQMLERDTVTWNSMIFGFLKRGEVRTAQSLFDTMPERDVITWNSLISGYLQNGEYHKSIDLFLQMRKMGIGIDHTTMALILKSCSSMADYCLGRQIHGLAFKSGISHDVVTASSLVDIYAKNNFLDNAFRFFYEIPERNWVCWSAMIAGCVQNNILVKSFELFKEMLQQGVGTSQSIYASLFRSCAGLSALGLGCQLHGHAIKSDFGSDTIVATATLDMFAKCNSLEDAKKIFNLIPDRNLQSYNALMVGYTRCSEGLEALQLFLLLRRSDLGFDEISLSVAFSAAALTKEIKVGVQIHALTVKRNLHTNVCVANAMLDMYGKCGVMAAARSVFDSIERRDAVSWNAIVAAYEQNGNEEETFSLFVSMLSSAFEPDEFTYGSVLKASSVNQALKSGIEIHARVVKSGMGLHSFVGSALVDMYCKFGLMDEALKLHERLEQTMVSCNSIISGYSLQKQDEEAQRFFLSMLGMGMKPDNFTYATVVDTCANLATVGLGKQIHGQIIKQNMHSDVFITSTLVDMYSKCGNMQESRLLFEKSPRKDFVTWNALLLGYAYHGFGKETLEIFEEMQRENVMPNRTTFVGLLRACGHLGLVEKGLYYFDLMSEYGLDPHLDHYSCMVDILGRSGRIAEALNLINRMPFEADDIIWRTLLSVCKMHGNVEVAKKAADSILKLDPDDSSVYVLLAGIYADAGIWQEVSVMRRMMRLKRIKKEPGCSWVEIVNEFHTFLANDKAHPECERIYGMLHSVYDEIWCVESANEERFCLDC